jgi:hypothetical protein
LVVNPPRPIIDTFFPTFLLLPFLSKSPPRANGGISFVALCRCLLGLHLSIPPGLFEGVLYDSGVGAKAVVIDHGDVMMAVAKYGKGTVFRGRSVGLQTNMWTHEISCRWGSMGLRRRLI